MDVLVGHSDLEEEGVHADHEAKALLQHEDQPEADLRAAAVVFGTSGPETELKRI